MLKRDEKLINLALAQFGTSADVILEVYNRANVASEGENQSTYNQGVRTACLSNRHLGHLNSPKFNYDVLFAKGHTPETSALLTNPSVDTALLEALKKYGLFAQIDEQNWLWMVQTAAQNKQLQYRQKHTLKTGQIWGLWGVQKAIFQLVESAPITKHGAYAVTDLLHAIDPRQASWPKEISHVLERWRGLELKNYKGDDQEGWQTFSFLQMKNCAA